MRVSCGSVRIVSALLGFVAIAAPARAIPTQPAKAKQIKADLVSAYNTCASPNTTHKPPIALPACSPPVPSTSNNPTNQLTFGSKGAFVQQLILTKGDIKLLSKGTDILNNGVPFSGTITGLATVRVTDNGCGGPSFTTACTIFDFPFPVPVNCTAGKCSGKTTANTVVPGAVNAGDSSNIEIGQLSVNDPDGDEAFRQGIFVP